MKTKLVCVAMSLGVLWLGTAGCGTPRPKPTAWNLSITKQTGATIEADLIGIKEMERSVWEGYSLDKYWDPNGDLRRENADKLSSSLRFGQPWVVTREDPKWKVWLGQGATHLLLIVNIPGKFPPGSADPRRVFIPLDKGAWDAKGARLEVEVQDTLVRVLTPQRLRR